MVRPELRATGFGYLLLALPVAVVVLFCFEPLGRSDSGAMEWRILPGIDQAEGVYGLAAGFFLLCAFQRLFRLRTEGELQALRSAVMLILVEALVLRAAQDLGVLYGAGQFPIEEGWIRSPWFFAPALAVVLLGWRYGVLVSLSGVWMYALLARPGTLSMVGALLGSMAAVLWLRRSTTRGRVLRAGLWSGALVASCVLLGGLLAGGDDLPGILRSVGVTVGVGFGSGILVLAFLPFVEWVLGELSDVSLTEYGTDHRLLDELRERAPGTWNHTINVADLARQAAAAIGARALFCYTAALFHDIGKLHRPEIFAENIDGPSPHEQLEPQESARLIIDHVSQGMELARKYRLPQPFRSIIQEHHGGSLVRFFHAKAVKQAADGDDMEALEMAFRYPGPRPSSKESGIISLADAVEAATRSMGESTPGEIREAVRSLIAERVAEGEYRDCPLTLAELGQVEATFCAWLTARCHRRPSYPQLEPVSAGSGLAVG